MAKSKINYGLAEWVTQKPYALTGRIGNVWYEGKLWNEMTQKDLQNFAKFAHPNNIKKYLVVIEETESNDTVQQEEKAANSTNEQEGIEPIK